MELPSGSSHLTNQATYLTYGYRFRVVDFAWLAFFAALAFFSPVRDVRVYTLVFALGAVQILETRLGAAASVILKLILCYPLIYFGGGIASSFYLILILPVISAATAFSLPATAAVTLAASVEYLSFLAFLDYDNQYIPGDQVNHLVLRALFLPVVGFLTHQLAEANRTEARKLHATAQQLAAANRSLKQAQADVRRADRLAALGQLTAGLAHELRNPLATIRTSAEMLGRNAGSNGVVREMAGYIAQEVDRTASLITRFLDFARPRHLKLDRDDLHDMLDTAIARFGREQPSGAGPVHVFKNYSPDVPPVRFDRELMEQVMANLLANAAQASPPGSAVTVKTQAARTPSGPAVEVSVIDRGAGIEHEHIEHVFNPFYTTKPDGVGLGLAIVSKIIDDHGGQVTVESAPREGSVFRVYLPVGEG